MSRIICALFAVVVTLSGSFALAAEEPIRLTSNPPDRHIVVKGDTLWGIAGKFLQEPWRWPEIWRLNKDQIRNPHLIYPGDVVMLDYVDGKPRLRLAKQVGVDRVEPTIYSEQLSQAIPSIPASIIEPFISKPLVVTQNELEDSPYVIGMDESRVIAGNGDEIYVRGIEEDHPRWGLHPRWYIYRQGGELRKPSDLDRDELGDVQESDAPKGKGEPMIVYEWKDGFPVMVYNKAKDDDLLGYEAVYVGIAQLKEPGDISVLELLSSKEEIMQGDRLIPADKPTLMSYVPRKMESEVKGRLVSFYGGVNSGGPLSVISISLGEQDGLEPGHVLGIYGKRGIRNRTGVGKSTVTALPEKRYGLVFVFRVFDRVSYGLVMESARPLQIGDAIRNP